jgi:hypothetical protein
MAELFIGLIAEGTTDYRFLKPIIEKAFADIAYQCKGQIDIGEVTEIKDCDKGNSFSDYVLNASQRAQTLGITILIVHTDADDTSSVNAYKNKIEPAKFLLEQQLPETHCMNLVALIPIRETESWMLADKNALMKSIGNTKKSETELKINGIPESFNDPKAKIEEAIRIGRAEMPKKLRNALDISGLYEYLGQTINLENLKTFKSYSDFEQNIKTILIQLNLL